MKPQRFYLHRRLAPLAQLASKDDSRPTLTAVHVTQLDNDKVQLEVTDGHALARVVATPDVKQSDFPDTGSPPPTQGQALIPAEAWRAAFKGIPKKNPLPALEHVEVSIGDDATTLTTTNLENQNKQSVRHVEGRFPDADALFPKRKPTFTVSLSAKLLGRVMGMLAQIDGGPEPKVKFEFYKPLMPVRVTMANKGYELSGLIMPMNEGNNV